MKMKENCNIISLYSNPLVVKNIIKKTKAMHWRELQVDDQIIIKLELRKQYYARGGFVPQYKIIFVGKKEFTETHNSLINRLSNFQLESYDPEKRSILDLF